MVGRSGIWWSCSGSTRLGMGPDGRANRPGRVPGPPCQRAGAHATVDPRRRGPRPAVQRHDRARRDPLARRPSAQWRGRNTGADPACHRARRVVRLPLRRPGRRHLLVPPGARIDRPAPARPIRAADCLGDAAPGHRPRSRCVRECASQRRHHGTPVRSNQPAAALSHHQRNARPDPAASRKASRDGDGDRQATGRAIRRTRRTHDARFRQPHRSLRRCGACRRPPRCAACRYRVGRSPAPAACL